MNYFNSNGVIIWKIKQIFSIDDFVTLPYNEDTIT